MAARPFVLLALLAAAACGAKKPAYPNAPIVLISIDTLRADAVTGFGAPPGRTPELDALGRESIRFDAAISATHVTAPSHATMLTGFSPDVHGVAMGHQGKAWAIPAGIPTLAETLRGAGYATVAFTDGVQLLQAGGFNRGFDLYDAKTLGLEAKLPGIERAIDGRGEKPIFLFAHTYRTHQPYRAPPDLLPSLFAEGYDGVYAVPARQTAWLTHREMIVSSWKQNQIARQLAGSLAKTDADRRFFRALYDAGVTGADREVGALLDLLRRTGIYDRAILCVTSDHGEAFWEHGADSHSTIFEPCIRVPLILRLPGGAGAGLRIPGVFPAIDLVPTLLDLAGLKATIEYEGESAAPSLLSGSIPERDAPLAWFYEGGRQWPRGRGVRSATAKRIVLEDSTKVAPHWDAAFGTIAHFDLTADPHEKVNAAGHGGGEESRLAAKLREVEARWKKLRARHNPTDIEGVELGADEKGALEAVGYVK